MDSKIVICFAIAALFFVYSITVTNGKDKEPATVNSDEPSGTNSNSVRPPMAGSVSSLITKLRDPVHAVQVNAAQSLGHLGPIASLAVPALIAAAASAPIITQHDDWSSIDNSLQVAAVEALGKIGPSAKAAVPMLMGIVQRQSVTSEDRKLQATAIIALGNMGTAAAPAVPLLASIILDKHAEVAFRALVQLGPTAAPALPSLLKLIESGTPYSDKGMCNVVAVLKAIGPRAEQAVPALTKWLSESNPKKVFNRRCVFDGIITIETDSVSKRELAYKYVHDNDLYVRQMALKVISQDSVASGANVKLLIGMLKKGLNGTLTTTGRVLTHHDFQSANQAIVGLGNAGPAAIEALPIIIHCDNVIPFSGGIFKDRKALAFEAIKKIDPDGSNTIPIISSSLALLKDKDKSQKEWNKIVSPTGAAELLEYIGSPQCKSYATEIRQGGQK